MIQTWLDDIALSIMVTGVLVGASAALLGTFLVLRGQSLLSDAISHSVVLGIVLVWMLTGQIAGPWQLVGAGLVGLATVALTEALARTRLVRMDAAIGLVFPALFALGVLLINIHARNVHIDAESVLLGEIGFVWLHTVSVAGLRAPVAVVTLAVVLAVNLGFVLLFYKELKLASFDPALAAALGFAPGFLLNVLLGLTSATAVAAFDAVGAILFVAFIVVPPATALLLSDRLSVVLALAVGLSAAAAILGYHLAVLGDVAIGGTMASMTGLFFAVALIAAPRHGLVARALRRRVQRRDNDCRALAAHLFTHAGTAEARVETTAHALTDHLRWSGGRAQAVILQGLDRGFIRRDGERLALTAKGEAVAREIFEPWGRGPPR